jgi:site-specific DNA-methyltransferase (adenine-specific)
MKTMDADSIDSIVSDPPYGIDFMGKGWDHGVPGEVFWREALRVAKPGAHLLAFGGTRTFHRLTVAIEDAGWEIRDCVMWVYGSGFPKSHNIGKAIDKAVTPEAAQWDGWGTALKPAWEPIIVARKPIIGTVAENVLKHGTGGMNIDGCRVEGEPTSGSGANVSNSVYGKYKDVKVGKPNEINTQGRFPANLIHDGSDEVVGLFPILHASGNKLDVGTGTDAGYDASSYEISYGGRANREYGSKGGSAARFFYCAKASKADRDEGNNHPTVKPTALMRYLCKLVTPLNGIILDPFMGSGSTGKAAILEGFQFTGIDITPEYVTIATARIEAALKEKAHQSVTLDSLL